ncbi:tryptophan halogenase family protein [Caulobacter sp. BK020]|uniref:tryptophan halogenase family protein n=1 Tax=Caulobacter sp. BK020 TaxID=2512117 RepID=UPI0010430384|nr:tryptophan halogenase family protein [Caulobacter sp. BK020]TCS15486.1 tryptophan halogenase [Caulobacter sp. BK020]
MTGSPLNNVAILGGGVAGWMTAAALARVLPPACEIRVIETADAAPRGALSTLPALRGFHGLLGLDEATVMRTARGTFKLGARYGGWTGFDHDHVEGFSDAGANLDGVAFHHHWLRARQRGEAGRYEDYSLAAVAGRLGRFAPPSEDPRSVLSTLSYGLHLDSAGYVAALRSTAGRVAARPGEIAQVVLDTEGAVQAVVLADGERIAADLFIDTTPDGRLIGATPSGGWIDETVALPCNRLALRELARRADPPPLTEFETVTEGWLRRVPLRDADAVTLAYASDLTSDDEARAILGGEATIIRRHNGRRERAWSKGCLAIGPAASQLEPLNGDDAQAIQSGVGRLIALLPTAEGSPLAAAEYNRLMAETFDRARDLAVLRYVAASRTDRFWSRARRAAPSTALAYKQAQFESRGRVVLYDEETFVEGAWVGALLGLGITPRRHDRLADRLPAGQADAALTRLRGLIRQAALAMPTHADALKDRP